MNHVVRVLRLVTTKAKEAKRRIVVCSGVEVLMDQASRLSRAKVSGATNSLLLDLLRVILSVAETTSPIRAIFAANQVKTVLQLCMWPEPKLRRVAAKLLERLAQLEESKVLLCELGAVPLLLSMAKLADPHVQHTASCILAELAEEPAKRTFLVSSGALLTMISLSRSRDTRIKFQAARAIADLAEAFENRMQIVYAALADLRGWLVESDDERVQEHAMRCGGDSPAPSAAII